LNQHPAVKFEGEMLETFKGKADESARQTEWIKNLFRPENASRYKALGFKTKHYDIPDQDAFRQSLQEIRPTILFSDRKNVIKRALSRLRIEQFAEIKRREMGDEEWLESFRSEQVWNIFREKEGIGSTWIDLVRLHSWVKWYEQVADKLKTFVQSLDLDVIHYDYEDIINDPDLFFEKIFGLLGVTPIQYETRSFKHTPDDLTKIIDNFRELQDFYTGTRFERYVS